jgi:glutamyl-tRNA reductase
MPASSSLNLLTFSHRNTSLAERDRLAYTYEQIVDFLPRAEAELGGEFGIISTCNRTEFYRYGPTQDDLWSQLGPLVADYKDIDLATIDAPDREKGADAARHLFRVSASLESMALGENEILGQVKDAHRLILEAETDSPIIERLFQFAVRAGKDVRTDTALCEGTVSVSSVAVDLAQKIFGDFSDRTILLLGAGETAETAAEHFAADGAADFLVVNRSRDRGTALADRFNGRFAPLDDLESALATSDIAVVATGSQDPLITREMLEGVTEQRRHDSTFLIDISNPRNVEPSAASLPSVYLYNMDDLQSVVNANKAARRDEIPKAESIIDHYVEEWEHWLQQQRVTPTISTLARYFEDARQRELDRHDGLSEEERSRLEAFSKGLIKKLLHDPITNLRDAVDRNALSSEQLEFVWSLYNLREFEESNHED